jgi:hypothetical protein
MWTAVAKPNVGLSSSSCLHVVVGKPFVWASQRAQWQRRRTSLHRESWLTSMHNVAGAAAAGGTPRETGRRGSAGGT